MKSKCKNDRTDGIKLAIENSFNINIEAERLCEFHQNLKRKYSENILLYTLIIGGMQCIKAKE